MPIARCMRHRHNHVIGTRFPCTKDEPITSIYRTMSLILHVIGSPFTSPVRLNWEMIFQSPTQSAHRPGRTGRFGPVVVFKPASPWRLGNYARSASQDCMTNDVAAFQTLLDRFLHPKERCILLKSDGNPITLIASTSEIWTENTDMNHPTRFN